MTPCCSASPSSALSESHLAPIVYVVDEDPVVRESLDSLIRSAGWRAETFACARTFLSRPRACVPKCLVLEVDLRDIGGLELQALVADRVDLPIIFVTSCTDVRTTVQAMKAGAVEFLAKPFDTADLIGAISQALERSHRVFAREAEARVLRERFESLSRREREVMTLVARGKLNKQVGGELGISEITVKAHRGKVMRKMKAGTLADLVNMTVGLEQAPAGPVPTPSCYRVIGGKSGVITSALPRQLTQNWRSHV